MLPAAYLMGSGSQQLHLQRRSPLVEQLLRQLLAAALVQHAAQQAKQAQRAQQAAGVGAQQAAGMS